MLDASKPGSSVDTTDSVAAVSRRTILANTVCIAVKLDAGSNQASSRVTPSFRERSLALQQAEDLLVLNLLVHSSISLGASCLPSRPAEEIGMPWRLGTGLRLATVKVKAAYFTALLHVR